MKELPEIIKILREEESLGTLQNKVQAVYQKQENAEGSPEPLPEKSDDQTVCFFEKSMSSVEENIEPAEKKFREIFNAMSDLLFYLDVKGNIVDINNAALEVIEEKKENIIGKPFSTIDHLFPKNQMKRHLELIKKTSRGENVNDYECDLKTHDETKHRFLFSNDIVKEGKTIKGILLRGRDVTQRQRAWDELVKLEEKYRVLAETSADGVITIDQLGRLTYINPSFEKMCGRRKSQILATLFRDYLLEDSVYFFQQVTLEVRKKNKKMENIELELVHIDDLIIPVEVNIAPLKKENEFAGMVLTLRDITERRKIEDELKKSERLKTEFMNIAAHELKSPVTPIKGYLDLIIQDENASEQIKKWAHVSLRNAERLLKLINDILDVSRLDSDTMRFEVEKLDTSSFLKEVAEDMKPAVVGKNLKFIVDIPKNLPNIMGDKNRLSQVLKNLLGNALKFTDNGSISLLATKKNEHLLITIEDTGIGISHDEIGRIFNKFYQAYTGADRNNEGTGLGLFICKEIISRHNGKIWAESHVRKGSNFIIELPYIHKMVVDLQNKK